jgi:redox-sensing transcriptional repressor
VDVARPDSLIRSGPLPDQSIRRLLDYRRVALRLSEGGQAHVSSQQLADLTGATAVNVRSDLNRAAIAGTRGLGYSTLELSRALAGLDVATRVVIAGVGRLGRALAARFGGDPDTELVSLFDVDPAVVGTVVEGVRVESLTEARAVLARSSEFVGVVATPEECAQQACDELVAAGAVAIQNYAPHPVVAPSVLVRNVDVVDEVRRLRLLSGRVALR